jgi:hypothetical protein
MAVVIHKLAIPKPVVFRHGLLVPLLVVGEPKVMVVVILKLAIHRFAALGGR